VTNRRAAYRSKPAAPRVTRADGTRANTYAAGCAACGHTVPAGAGILAGSRADGWKVTHAPQRLVSHFPQDVKYAGGCEEARETQPVWQDKPAREPADFYGRHNTSSARGRCEDAPCCGCCW
jgi:hypothetical protein